MTLAPTNHSIDHIFILHLKQEQDPVSSERDPVRIILKVPRTGELHSFQSLNQLVIFLAEYLPDSIER